MNKSRFHTLPLLVLLTGCNLFGAIDKPSGDAQLLAGARACLDSGDYVCARERYNALSSSMNDIRLSELAFTTMAESQVFSIRDLIDTLGSNRGDGKTFARLAEVIAARGQSAASVRGTLQSTYASASGIGSTELRAFTQFLVALSTFNQVLSSAVGADGLLTPNDIAGTSTTTGASNPCIVAAGTCNADPACAASAGISNTVGDVTDLSTASGWTGAASMGKLQAAASDASIALGNLGGSSSLQGILNSMKELDDLLGAAATDGCKRQVIIQILFP
jgi:hypothetical protein